ncbi:MAG: alpha/beta hydrolase [Acidobacteriia bacterium]|nr:alpha/beta hydrolase [Terriglobia bacterium]
MSVPIRIAYGSDASQFGDLRLPSGPGPHPVLVVIHGGFWRARYSLEETARIASDLARSGFATWNIEYRRVGQAGGGWPGTLQDVAQAADHLLSLGEIYPLDLNRVVSLGHSVGGHLALWLTARRRLAQPSIFVHGKSIAVCGVISLAGVCDLVQMAQVEREENPVLAFLGGTPSDFPERYAVASPAALLPLSVPQVLLHGDADDRVPVSISRDYARSARAAGDRVSYIELPGVGHFEFINPDSVPWARTMDALKTLLPPRS